MLGWAQEHGPYSLDDGQTQFAKNEYSWNNEANVFYVESPAGVGFSICPDKSECDFDDNNSADDNLQAVLAILQKFPEINQNDLYIAGESYAGIYVPKLVDRIDKYLSENAATNIYKPNLKGFMVGNGVTDWKFDTTPAFLQMSYWQGLYDDATHKQMLDNCNFTDLNFNGGNLKCEAAVYKFYALSSNMNIYDLFGKCYSSTGAALTLEESDKKFLMDDGTSVIRKEGFTAADYTPWLFQNFNSKNLKEVPPCVYATPILNYLNSDSVRASLNIPADAPAWDLCANINYNNALAGSLDIWANMKGKYRMLKYSGDTDGAVPTFGTRQWINELNWKVTSALQPFTVDGQTAGFVETREGGFTFVSIHGAGHMAPQWKRPQTYYAIFNWLNNKQI